MAGLIPLSPVRDSGILNIVSGLSAAVGSPLIYFLYTTSFRILTNQILAALLWLSYMTTITMFFGVFATVVGMRQLLQMWSKEFPGGSQASVSVQVATVLSTKRYWKALLLSAVAYGVFYATVSSIIVYRPGQNFAVDYLAVIPSVVPIVCCGGPGFIPIFTVYLTEHLGLLIIPANVLLMILVSSLVGVNVALALYGYDNRPKGAKAGWFSGLGAITGLFTACPTCAGLFLGTLIQGVGTVATATLLAGYQPLFLAVTFPVLIGSTYLMGRRLKHGIYGSCVVSSRRR